MIILDCKKERVTSAKSDTQESTKSTGVVNSPVNLASLNLSKQTKPKKFGRFFQKPTESEEEISYCQIYEKLHNNIKDFNREFDYYNRENKGTFNQLISNITSLIRNRFPGNI